MPDSSPTGRLGWTGPTPMSTGNCCVAGAMAKPHGCPYHGKWGSTDAHGLAWYRQGTSYMSSPNQYVVDMAEFRTCWELYVLVSSTWVRLYRGHRVSECMRVAEIHHVVNRED
jgi:hypothetical protein